MIEFLKGGKKLNGISMGMTVSHVREILGEDENYPEMDSGFLYYNEFRYGYDENHVITEMAIIFSGIKRKFKFENLEKVKQGISLLESFSIGRKTKMNEMIYFINYLGLNWTSSNIQDEDYMKLKIENGPFIVFYLYDGLVDKISVIDGYQ